MSRRLATVLRVAALQERLAKAEAGRAGLALEDAGRLHTDRLEALSAARLTTGSPAALQQVLAVQGLRARAAAEAEQGIAAAGAARTAALDAWRSAQGRHRLLAELDARLAEERLAAELAAAQRLADDLSAGRRGGRR